MNLRWVVREQDVETDVVRTYTRPPTPQLYSWGVKSWPVIGQVTATPYQSWLNLTGIELQPDSPREVAFALAEETRATSGYRQD